MQAKTFATVLLSAFVALSSACAKAPAVGDKQFQWLGAIPEHRDLGQLSSDLTESTMKKAQDNIAKSRQDLLLFSCKNPAQVGPVDDMAAVDLYIDGLPDSNQDSAILKRLFASAQKGNWLARLQTFSHLAKNGNTAEEQYLAAKSLEWLVTKDVGGVYSFIGAAVQSSGYFSDSPEIKVTPFDVYAALHNGYPAQHKVGRALLDAEDSRLQAVGKEMVACAEKSIPSYRRLFTGEAAKLKADREQKLLEKSYSEIHWAIKRNQITLVKEILQRSPEQLNAKTDDGYMPIEFALRQPVVDPGMIKELIDHGAQVKGHELWLRDRGGEEHVGLLSLATTVAQPNMEVVRLLVRAGADPINPLRDSFSFQTPFHASFDAYENGQEDLLEFYLSTKKLIPGSKIAKEYLVQAIGKRKVFNRLLKYGISPVGTEDFWIELGPFYKEMPNLREDLRSLVSRYPQLRDELKSKTGAVALSRAVRNCHFEFATELMGLGVRPNERFSSQSGGLLRSLVEHCGRTTIDDAIAKKAFANSRDVFLRLAVEKGLVLNVVEGRCPAWTTFSCAPPADDELAKLLMQLGADPYQFYPQQEYSVLQSLVRGCRFAVLKEALAKGPSRTDPNVMKGLSLALSATEESMWSKSNCPADFASAIAKLLISYGAKKESGAD